MTRNQAANDRMKLRTFLRNSDGHSSIETARIECTGAGDRTWSIARIMRAIEWDDLKIDNRANIKIVRGGKGIRLVENDERVGIGQGAKAEVVRAISAESKFVLNAFGTANKNAKNLRVIETGKRASPEHGSNARPDIVVGAYLDLNSRRPMIHNIEFQGKNTSGKNTFTTSDIAQAFTCGRGADYSWVMIHNSARKFKKDNYYEEWERTLWFAEWLGVGIITYSDPCIVSTWKPVIRAKKRARMPIYSTQYAKWLKRLMNEDRHPKK